MRTLGRRAAIGLTSLALLLAAAGTSVAAVRSSRYQGGLVPSGLALPAPAAGQAGTGGGPGTPLDPTTDLPLIPDAGTPADPGTFDPSTGLSPPGSSGSSPSTSSGASGTTSGPTSPGQSSTAGTPTTTQRVTVPTLGPAGGPTPTTGPSRPSSVSCPGDEGSSGALPRRTGPLQAVDFELPWPVVGPVALYPLPSVTRPADASLRIVTANVPVAEDGVSLTLPTNKLTRYTVTAGEDRAQGTITFTPIGFTENVQVQACPDRSFVLFDVDRAVLNGHAVRIVGVVAPAGTVTIDEDGGRARFRGPQGSHRVTLLTASDAGDAGTLITATVLIP